MQLLKNRKLTIMMDYVRRPNDVFSGAVFLGVGVGAFILARDYELGTATSMGAGYFPTMLAILLGLIGAGLIANGFRSPPAEVSESHSLEPLLLIVAGVMLFAILIERTGLIAAIFVLVFCSCFRRLFTNPIEVVVVASILAGFSALVFVYAFNLPFPLFPVK